MRIWFGAATDIQSLSRNMLRQLPNMLRQAFARKIEWVKYNPRNSGMKHLPSIISFGLIPDT